MDRESGVDSTPTEMPKEMAAVLYRRYGSPDVLRTEMLPVPVPATAELLVKVQASTVNRTDCGFLRGKPMIVRFFSGLLTPDAPVLGCEFSGQVVATGDRVTEFQVGDRVFAFKDDDFGFGGHAEYTTMPVAGMVAKVPTNISTEQAAAALEGAHYALHYIRAAGITDRHAVLINGATGAIGSAALQLIRDIGAKVTAVCATEHVELVRAMGADAVVDYQQEDFTALDKTFDVVFDAVGKSTAGKCRKLLRNGGTYMSTELGPFCQNPLLAILSRIRGDRKVLFPLPENLKADAGLIRDKLQSGAFVPLVDRSYTLAEVADAFRYVETGMKVGNVVIAVGEKSDESSTEPK